MNRRDFLQLSAYLMGAVHIAPSLLMKSAAASVNPLKGKIVAACYNPVREGAYSRHTHQTVVSRLDLATGRVDMSPVNIQNGHDLLQVRDNYLVLPNFGGSKIHATDLSHVTDGVMKEGGAYYNLLSYLQVTGHGFYDDQNNVVMISAQDNKRGKGCFALLDPVDFKLLDIQYLKGSDPHDIQLYDEDTIAVCHYNYKHGYWNKKKSSITGLANGLKGGHSQLYLYDRKTLKKKHKIEAYDNAMISHATVTNDGDLYAIGFREYEDKTIDQWSQDDIEKKFLSFYKDHHPELLDQWHDIAQAAKIHRVEKSIKKFGLPLLPIVLEAGEKKMNIMQFDDFHHRRAQSICYNQNTNTVCMAFPNSDSILLYDPTTKQSRNFYGHELNLKEMRGITPIDDTPYIAVAGIRRGITVIDTLSYKIVQHFDVGMGRIVHMHHHA